MKDEGVHRAGLKTEAEKGGVFWFPFFLLLTPKSLNSLLSPINGCLQEKIG